MLLRREAGRGGKRLLHPGTVTFVPVLLCTAAFMVPPSIYQSVIGEPDYMRGNWLAIMVLAVFWLAFLIGSFSEPLVRNAVLDLCKNTGDRTVGFRGLPKPNRLTLDLVLMIVIVLELLLVGTVVVRLGVPRIVGLLDDSAGGGLILHAEFLRVSKLGGVGLWPVLPISVGLMSWVFAELLELRKPRKYLRQWLLLTFAVVLQGAGGLVSVTRWTIYLTIVAGLTVVLRDRVLVGQWRVFRTVRLVALMVFLMGALFFGMQALKSHSGGNLPRLEVNFLGYTIASVNRFAAIVDGVLKLNNLPPLSNVLDFLYKFPLLHKLVGTDGLPVDMSTVYGPAMARSGLNPGYQWLTIFGAAYKDLKWAGIVYFFLYGYLARWVYREFLVGRDFGLVMYPYIWGTIIFWFGFPAISAPTTIFIALSAGIVGGAKLLTTFQRGDEKWTPNTGRSDRCVSSPTQ